MKEITLHKQWLVRASIEQVFGVMTNFEKFPEYFPEVAESIHLSA
jgi:ribosome-associated toxin RatA of RatAB toxin-antitoxin module